MKYTSPPDKHLYNNQVWDLVRQIPPGKVATYGQIAGLVPPPAGMPLQDYTAWGARWVGGAMAACPADVPWQRVVNAQGKISQRRGISPDDPFNEQRQLLEEEGVIFDDSGRLDLKRFGWSGPL